NILFDGKDPLPLLTKGATSSHETFYFNFRKHAALRQGDWKIVRENPNHRWQLFNLKNDLSESRNRAEERPEQLEKLKASFAAWEKTF
ncbi:MAG: hypothetical protein P8M70_09735, partial [Verrucomicrobiota bacterium]|nr:hypothetical protein [Verrucomicrobiota bacterium]